MKTYAEWIRDLISAEVDQEMSDLCEEGNGFDHADDMDMIWDSCMEEVGKRYGLTSNEISRILRI